MRRIEFYNRKKEIKEVMDILTTEPSLITFVYGPINSGKTEFMNHLIKQLHESYVVFYVNLRGKFISNYKDFVRALFKIDREKKDYKDVMKAISEVSIKTLKFAGIPVPENILDLLFREKTYEDIFEFLEEYFTKIAESRIPVFILDELQVIENIKIDDLLIYRLFNFFIRLTKELHISHVFAISSDSLFLERVYNESMLQGRCDYFLVNDFDYNTTIDFLDKYGFSNNEKEIAWNYCRGKLAYLVKLINAKRSGKDIDTVVKEMLKIRVGQIKQRIGVLKMVSKKVLFEEEEFVIKYDNVIKVLVRFLEGEYYAYEEVTPEITHLVKENLLFVDPVKRIIKPQSIMDLLAIREILSSIKNPS